MEKIERVIQNCRDCRYMIRMQEMAGNTFFVGVCGFQRLSDSDVASTAPFMIVLSGSSNSCFQGSGIPEDCPLENYGEVENG